MKFLYLTPNFEKYTASQYQKDVYNHLKKYVEVKLWGPGFNGFDINSDHLQKFKDSYSEYNSELNLKYWNDFEIQFPRTFISMYRFWVSKL